VVIGGQQGDQAEHTMPPVVWRRPSRSKRRRQGRGGEADSGGVEWVAGVGAALEPPLPGKSAALGGSVSAGTGAAGRWGGQVVNATKLMGLSRGCAFAQPMQRRKAPKQPAAR